jgi:hypothetical protein
MKCPKCGFNSFEHYDTCTKCSSDLTAYKLTYSISSLVLPLAAKQYMASEKDSAEFASGRLVDTVEAHDDIFSFDLPDEPPAIPVQPRTQSFKFDETSVTAMQQNDLTIEDDPFADLLESTNQAHGISPPSIINISLSAPAVENIENAPSAPGEFDLDSFSWDDMPGPAAATDTKKPEDDLDSLFAPTKESAHK